MFAGAAREAVFANPEVVRRVNADFIPVALKAGLVNNPPRGIEGKLYTEIARSKPAPQGICTVNSVGKVLSWALSFDDDASILSFLDHVAARYEASPDETNGVIAERFMKFPSQPMPDVADAGKQRTVPEQHTSDERCPGEPKVQSGTLVGRVIGRPLDEEGKPIAATLRQEDYMEARFEISVLAQRQLSRAAKQAKGELFAVPNEFVRELIEPAFLGQLDVNPLGVVPGSSNHIRDWQFTGLAIESDETDAIRIQIVGESDLEGGPDAIGRGTDGRQWEHRVSLAWQGYVDLHGDQIASLQMIAEGDERLRWGNDRFQLLTEPTVQHLMAGHPIDFRGPVRYGLTAKPAESTADN